MNFEDLSSTDRTQVPKKNLFTEIELRSNFRGLQSQGPIPKDFPSAEELMGKDASTLAAVSREPKLPKHERQSPLTLEDDADGTKDHPEKQPPAVPGYQPQYDPFKEPTRVMNDRDKGMGASGDMRARQDPDGDLSLGPSGEDLQQGDKNARKDSSQQQSPDKSGRPDISVDAGDVDPKAHFKNNSDGTVTRDDGSGKTLHILPNGTTIETSDHNSVTRFQSGRIDTQSELPNGNILETTQRPDGKVTLKTTTIDGKTITSQSNPDGSGSLSLSSADGRTTTLETIKEKHGHQGLVLSLQNPDLSGADITVHSNGDVETSLIGKDGDARYSEKHFRDGTGWDIAPSSTGDRKSLHI